MLACEQSGEKARHDDERKAKKIDASYDKACRNAKFPPIVGTDCLRDDFGTNQNQNGEHG